MYNRAYLDGDSVAEDGMCALLTAERRALGKGGGRLLFMRQKIVQDKKSLTPDIARITGVYLVREHALYSLLSPTMALGVSLATKDDSCVHSRRNNCYRKAIPVFHSHPHAPSTAFSSLFHRMLRPWTTRFVQIKHEDFMEGINVVSAKKKGSLDYYA